MPGVEIFGVSQETTTEVQEWLRRYNRSFNSVVNATKVFEDFQVGPIPILVVVDKKGVVADCEFGVLSEQALRSLIEKY
jgi:hypothetical protein